MSIFQAMGSTANVFKQLMAIDGWPASLIKHTAEVQGEGGVMPAQPAAARLASRFIAEATPAMTLDSPPPMTNPFATAGFPRHRSPRRGNCHSASPR